MTLFGCLSFHAGIKIAMSGSDSDPDAAAAAMAAAMGFSAFGGADRPSKKRRFNPRADAVTAVTAAAPAAAVRPSGTGANQTPLGRQLPIQPREAAPQSPAAGLAEQADDEADATDGSVDGGAVLQAQVDGSAFSSHGFQPDVVAASPNAGRGSISGIGSHFTPQDDDVDEGVADDDSHAPHPPGHRNKKWYVGYYDRSSNDNPWARLEAKLGLEPKGSWPAASGPVGQSSAGRHVVLVD